MSERLQWHAVFHGRVQGVCFRAITRQIAKKIGLTGTVKNMPEGTVEVYAQGTKNQIEQLLSALDAEFGHDHIHNVESEYREVTREEEDFNIIF